MLFRIVCICILLAACYGGYRAWSIYSHYDSLRSPKAEFTVREAEKTPAITIVEFLNYGCTACLRSHRVILDYARKNADITLVVRPVPFKPDHGVRAAEMAMAAGLQGKFWEMDSALSEYEEIYDDGFYRDTAAVYDIDYDRMLADSIGEEAHRLAADNLKAALEAGVEYTPALMVGKTLYQPDGILTLPELIRMVQKERAGQ